MHGYGDEIYKMIKEEQKNGASIGIKKHLRYHQLQLNEICDKIIYDDNRFENMRNEIILQRQQLAQYYQDNQFLRDKVEHGVQIMNQVEETLKTIQIFKAQIENDREGIFTAVIKTQEDWNVLHNKVDKIRADFEIDHTEKVNRIVNLETNSREHQNDIEILKKGRINTLQKLNEVSITTQDLKQKIDFIWKGINDQMNNLRDTHESDMKKIKSELEELSLPVLQAIDNSKKEAESIMYELKRVQSESRWMFSEFDKTKTELQQILETLNLKDSSQNQILQQTVSIVNVDTKVSLPKRKMPDTLISTTSGNAFISPFAQTRTESSQSLFTKTSLAKLPILRSKREYMTARNISRNSRNSTIDNDIKTYEGPIVKESEGELVLKEYLNYAQFNSNVKKNKCK